MKYVVELDGERITVELDGAEATVDGVAYPAVLEAVEGTPMRLLRLGDTVHRVMARRDGARGRYRLAVNGWTYSAEALDERTRAIRDLSAAAAEASGPAPIVAPMPGLVIRILVAVGDVVVAGQGLAVMEAMKMENELRAAAPGVVSAIRVAAGAAVDKGAVLVELAPPPEPT